MHGRSIIPSSWQIPWTLSSVLAPALCLGLAIGTILPTVSAAEDTNSDPDEYRLAAQDKLRINILQWLPGAGNYQQWTALNNDYLVGASGSISIPLLGVIPAANLTTSELAATIARRLKLRAGLGVDPDVSIEILEYRPVYVVGQVQTPGEYKFRPGLTTTKSLAIAGGVFRDNAWRGSRERDRINAQSAFDDAQLQMRRNLVRRARLHAELEELDRDAPGGGSFAIPDGLKPGPTTQRLIFDEERIKQARMSRLSSQIAATQELITLLQSEDASLENKIKLQRQNRDLAQEESEKIDKLRKRDLVVNSRWLSTQLALADHEARLLDLETASLRIKQELSKAERSIIDAKADLRTNITNELQQLESSIDLLHARTETAVALLAEANEPTANVVADTTLLDTSQADPEKARSMPVVTYTIIRQTGDRPARTIVADAKTRVLPGDVINVAVVPADSLPAELLNLSSSEPEEQSDDLHLSSGLPSELEDPALPIPRARGSLGALAGDPTLNLTGGSRKLND